MTVTAILPALIVGLLEASPYAGIGTDPGSVKSISIESVHGSIGCCTRATLVISGTNGRFVADGKPVPLVAVTNLLRALQNHDVSVTPASIGLTAVASDAKTLSAECLQGNSSLKDLPKKLGPAVTDPRLAAEYVHWTFSGRRLAADDYPSEKVTVVFEDGTKIEAQSDSQADYMIPFKIAREDSSHLSYSPAIARAIAALFPNDVNHDRLGGQSLKMGYAEFVCATDSAQIAAMALDDYMPGIRSWIRDQGYAVSDIFVTADAGEVRLIYGSRFWPKALTVDATVSKLSLGTTGRLQRQLSMIRAVVDGALRHRSLGAAIRRAKQVSVAYPLDDIVASGSDVRIDLLQLHHPNTYLAVRPFLGRSLGLELSFSKAPQYDVDSAWIILPDGSVLLETCYPDSFLGGPKCTGLGPSWLLYPPEQHTAERFVGRRIYSNGSIR